MRIGLVSYEYPPQRGLGGVGTYTYRLAGALGRAGHQVVVVAGPTDDQERPQPNVIVHRIPAHYNPSRASKALRCLYWRALAPAMSWMNPMVWHWLRWDLATGEVLSQIHRQTPLDVIEAPEHAANGLVAEQLGKWPVVVRIHGPWDLFYRLNRTDGIVLNRLLSRLEQASAHRAHALTTPSQSMAAFMRDRWSLGESLRVIPNFMTVPRQRYAPPLPGAPQRIVCAGRIERFKGQDVLVKAFALMARAHPKAQLVLIGPDQWSAQQPFKKVVEELVPDAALRDRIILAGPRPLHIVQEELRRAAVAVISSTGFESFSFSTLEAMAAARPIVATRAGAIPELLGEGNCGVLVEPGDVPGMSRGLDRLLADADFAYALGNAAHARARREYDTAAVLPRLVHTYARTREAVRGWGELPTSLAELMVA